MNGKKAKLLRREARRVVAAKGMKPESTGRVYDKIKDAYKTMTDPQRDTGALNHKNMMRVAVRKAAARVRNSKVVLVDADAVERRALEQVKAT